MFGITVKIGPSLGGVLHNKDEHIAEMKEALFVTHTLLKPPLAVPSSTTVTMNQLDYNSTMAPNGLSAARIIAKQDMSARCLRVLNIAIVVARH